VTSRRSFLEIADGRLRPKQSANLGVSSQVHAILLSHARNSFPLRERAGLIAISGNSSATGNCRNPEERRLIPQPLHQLIKAIVAASDPAASLHLLEIGER
jgi:hypothetical protein